MSDPSISISFSILGAINKDLAHDLDSLADLLIQNDIDVNAKKTIAQGKKDAGVTTALAIASLGLSAISTLITVLSYWSSTRPKYKVSVQSRKVTYELDNIDKNELRNVITNLKSEDPDQLTINLLPR